MGGNSSYKVLWQIMNGAWLQTDAYGNEKAAFKNAPVNKLSELFLERETTMHQTRIAAPGTTLCLPGTVAGALQLVMVAIMMTDTAQGT